MPIDDSLSFSGGFSDDFARLGSTPGYVIEGVPSTGAGRQFPYYAQLRKADPYFERDRVNQVEYEFPGRTFSANPATRGAYNDEPNGDLVMVDDGSGQGPAPTNIFSETTPDIGSIDKLFTE